MPSPIIIRPPQVTILGKVLDEHCGARGIVSTADREDVALRLIALFASGAKTADALRAGLAGATEAEPRRVSAGTISAAPPV